MASIFEQCGTDDIVALIDEHPLAWVVALGRGGDATPLPIILDLDDDRQPVGLTGHIPKAHPMVATLTADPRAMFLFSGPHGYISPEPLTDRDWAPTWNFAVIRIYADVTFDDASTDRALRRLVDKMEAGRPRPWSVEEMGDRYAAMRAKVIGFRAAIRSITPRFKLGQDERPAVFDEIVESLRDPALIRWMRRFDRSRGKGTAAARAM